MEQPKDIFPPVHRKKMGDQDRRRYTGHFQKFLGRLLIDKEQSKRPNGHDNQKRKKLTSTQIILILMCNDEAKCNEEYVFCLWVCVFFHRGM